MQRFGESNLLEIYRLEQNRNVHSFFLIEILVSSFFSDTHVNSLVNLEEADNSVDLYPGTSNTFLLLFPFNISHKTIL